MHSNDRIIFPFDKYGTGPILGPILFKVVQDEIQGLVRVQFGVERIALVGNRLGQAQTWGT